MNKLIKLSKRLKTIANFLPDKTYFADIGSDHAFLPRYICDRNKNAKAIAGEVSEGPYQAAHKTVVSSGLSHSIDVRLGDGLEVIRNEPVTEVVIAGMGGALIAKILDDGKKSLKTVERIITQPNVNERIVRKWLTENNYIITDEKIISENNHLYEIIVADKNKGFETIQLDEKELLFGPILLKDNNSLFYEKWKSNQLKTEQILTKLNMSTNPDLGKQEDLMKKLTLIKEVLLNE